MISDKPLINQLAEYVKKNLKKGYTKESLKWALINHQGYSRIEVEKAFKKVDEDLAVQAPVLITKPKISYQVQSLNQPQEKKSFWKKLFG